MCLEIFQVIELDDRDRVVQLLETNPEWVDALNESGATPLHQAALLGRREIARILITKGADIRCRDRQFGATPTGWAIEYLRGMGGVLAVEIDDLAYAIEHNDIRWVARFLSRFPSLAQASTADGTPLKTHAQSKGNPEIVQLFETADGSTHKEP